MARHGTEPPVAVLRTKDAHGVGPVTRVGYEQQGSRAPAVPGSPHRAEPAVTGCGRLRDLYASDDDCCLDAVSRSRSHRGARQRGDRLEEIARVHLLSLRSLTARG